MTTPSTNQNTAVSAAQSIDDICKHAAAAFAAPASFEQELAVARSIVQLRGVLQPVMGDVMALMNTSLGFRTDRDPNVTPKDKDGNPMTPYPVAIVTDVFIEARLRGFHAINNEFNIIAGRFYGCVTGFERLVKSYPKVTDVKDNYSIPTMHGEKGAIVKASATWIQDGVKQSLERDFAVRVNYGMGADAIVGKAKRKLYAAVYSRLSGVVTPEGEAGDDVTDLKSIAAASSTPASASALFGANGASKPAEKVSAGAETATPAPQKPPAGNNTTPAATSAPAVEPTPKDELVHTLVTSNVPFDDFRDFVRTKNLAKDPDAWGSYEDVPEKVALWFKNNPKTLVDCIRTFGKVQAK